MLTINTNLSSLIAQGSMKSSTNKLNQAIERMTTGFKINHAKDNAANYSIATNMTTKIGAYNVAEDNAAMGLDLISTAEGTLSQIEDKLQRLRALAEQASNGTYGEQSLNAINAEANALVDEIERIYNNSEYNGINLMKGRVTGTEESKFIKDIDRRDTSKMTTLASVDETEKLEYGTYSISTAEELAKLATMTNNGLIGADTEFVQAADIDLSGYSNWTPIGKTTLDDTVFLSSFNASYNGNGYTVANLKISSSEMFAGLFGCTYNAQIENLGIEGLDISANSRTGGIVGQSFSSLIVNCYVKGGLIEGSASDVGGIVGFLQRSDIQDCYSDISIKGVSGVGGIAGYLGLGNITNCYSYGDTFADSSQSNYAYAGGIVGGGQGITFYDCYSFGTITGTLSYTGGIAGFLYRQDSSIINSYSFSKSTNYLGGIFVGTISNNTSLNIENCFYDNEYDSINLNRIYYIADGSSEKSSNILGISDFERTLDDILDSSILNYNSFLCLQTGISSNLNSQIFVSTGYLLDSLSILRRIGIGTGDYLTMIDKMLANASEKQTHFGATSNRLESVLEEITIQRDNLVSSRSTIRDADIAELSSHYIQQQILQQAAATLLATANQSPSIALQLI